MMMLDNTIGYILNLVYLGLSGGLVLKISFKAICYNKHLEGMLVLH